MKKLMLSDWVNNHSVSKSIFALLLAILMLAFTGCTPKENTSTPTTSNPSSQFLERHGKPVEELVCHSKKEMYEKILEKLHVGAEGYETAAILTMTEKQAKKVYQYLKEHRDDVYYVDRDSSNFRKGVTVTTYYLAKGLEFDQVFVAGGEKENPLYSQFLYISATRALHELIKLEA